MIDAGKTSPTQLRRLGNWGDHAAWLEFVSRYELTILSHLPRFHLSREETDEVHQRIFFQLARRMRTYQYDPSKTFRGWLRRLCESRAIDQIRNRKLNTCEPLIFDPVFKPNPPASLDDDDSPPGDRPRLLVEAERVHQLVRGKVNARTWSAFWLIAVEGQSCREAAHELGMSYAAAFVAQKRVKLRLRNEGERSLEPPR